MHHSVSVPPKKVTFGRRDVYLLDRNIIIVIKRVVNGGTPKNTRESKILKRLSSRDRDYNTFSIVLSITEGEKGRPQTPEEFVQVATTEARAVGKYFKNARTDGDIWTSQAGELLAQGIVLQEANFKSYHQFLEWVSPLICEPTSPFKKMAKALEIILAAKERGIQPQHPVVWCSLACLYGNKRAQKVMKPTKSGENAYNALNDIMVISRIQQYQAIDAETIPGLNFRFMTLDVNLQQLYETISFGTATLKHDADRQLHVTKSTLNVNRNMFPDTTDEEYDFLLGELAD